MGVFCEQLHIAPWDVDRLTAEQFDALAEYVTRPPKG